MIVNSHIIYSMYIFQFQLKKIVFHLTNFAFIPLQAIQFKMPFLSFSEFFGYLKLAAKKLIFEKQVKALS